MQRWPLPDTSTGQGPDTLARKLSRRAPRECSEQRGCKEGEPAPQQRSGGGGALFAVMVQILLSITRVAVQV
jgi:hypothetical protein